MNGLPVHRAEEAVHLALPRPSIWPLLLSAALCALMIGLLLIRILAVLGWGIETRHRALEDLEMETDVSGGATAVSRQRVTPALVACWRRGAREFSAAAPSA